MAFVGVNTFDLNIENSIGVDEDIVMNFDVISERDFADMFNFSERIEELFVIDRFIEEVELFRMTMPNSRAKSFIN